MNLPTRLDTKSASPSAPTPSQATSAMDATATSSGEPEKAATAPPWMAPYDSEIAHAWRIATPDDAKEQRAIAL